MNTIVTFKWEHTYIDFIVTQEEAISYMSQIEECITQKAHYKLSTLTKTVLIPYYKLKQAVIMFAQTPA